MESNSFLKVGTMLNHAKYRIERYLASGGFGNTYEGVNVSLGKKCAIKEFFLKGIAMRNEQTTDVHIAISDNKRVYNSQREKFTKEARRLSSLDNTHVVRVFDFFEENGTAYYVMDYIEGESLREYQKRTGKVLTEREALSVLTQMLDALKTIHENGLLHMDIKPANIMIDNKGKCTLIDFGASKQSAVNDSATTSSTMAYTPGYAPTEQISGSSDRWGPWTDFYALGATLYNLLTNENPGNLDIEEDGEEAFKFPAELSASTRNVIQWMMSPKRKDRPQSVYAIQNCLNQLGINAGGTLSALVGNRPVEEARPVEDEQPVENVAVASMEPPADADATEIDSRESADLAVPATETQPTEADETLKADETLLDAKTEIAAAKNAVETSSSDSFKADSGSTPETPIDTAYKIDSAAHNDTKVKIAPISLANERKAAQKKKGNLGKWVAVFLSSLLLVVAFVFLVKNIDSDSGNGTKTNKTTISADKKNVSDAKKGKSAKSNNEQYRPVNKGNTVRQESQHASSKTPSQSNNLSQPENNVKPKPAQLGRQINSKTEKNNSRTINQTKTRNRNVVPDAAVDEVAEDPAVEEAASAAAEEPVARKRRNATSSNGHNNKAVKAKAQGDGQAVKQQNRNANSSTSVQSAKRKQSEIDAAWGNVDNSNSAKANEIDAAW